MGLNGQMARPLFVARLLGPCLAGALWLMGCGSGGSPTVEDTPPDDQQDASNAPGKRGDAGTLPPVIDPDDIIDGIGDTDGGATCTKVTCDDLSYTCGKTPDGCGGVLDCGTCAEGSECGIVARHACTELDSLCMPIDKEEACDGKQCGSEGDGCGGLYDCGTCDEGEACGLDEAFQCGKLPASTIDDCVGKIASCEEAGVTCGKIGNGCGGIIDCDAETGGCGEGEVCGVGGANECGVPPACEPVAADVACADKCGIVSNGCGEEVDGGLIDCSLVESSQCADGTECGAGGVPNQCGTAETACVPVEQVVACATVGCGVVSDGCAGSYSCQGCAAGEQCQQGSCQALCVPVAQATACAGKTCGSVSDQCGGVYQCGTCPAGQQCGGSEPFQCSLIPAGPGSPDCVPLDPTVACNGRECGTVFDGCGSDPENEIDCSVEGNGGCATGEYCGIVAPFQCDEPPGADCEPDTTSCAEANWACGKFVDECGDVIDCSGEGLTCGEFEACVGGTGGTATECITGGGGGSQDNCDVCHAIPVCDEAEPTTVTGRVITPGKNDGDTANQVGVPNAFVYILRNNDASELPSLPQGIPAEGAGYGTSCDRCEDQDLGPVLASATTNAQGEYTLSGNIPVDEEFVLVVKIGKWRRAQAVTLASSAACETTALSHLQTRLPRTQSDGLAANIPHMAISTGSVDAMECVFYKLGVAGSEFAQPGNDGTNPARIHMYRSDDRHWSGGSWVYGAGASMSDGHTDDPDLYTNTARLFGYDMVVFDCEGHDYDDDDHDPRIREFVNRGGRMFASHWAYTWINDNGSAAYDEANPYITGLSQSADWDDGATELDDAYVSLGRPGVNTPKLQKFADWLEHEGAATYTNNRYEMSITEPRDLAASVNEHSEEFVYRTWTGGGSSVQQYAFNTPYGAPEDAICGRVAYSGFHVVAPGGGNYTSSTFPNHCAGNLTAQEKILLYMLFDLGACVSTDEPVVPSCNPEACGTRCGIVPDGCGDTLDCGACPPPSCVPTTCATEGATCGTIADGCGGTVTCGPCDAGQICGLVAPNQCAPVCTPMDEATACADSCGFVSDGCGGVYECSGCDGSLSCIDEACVPGQCVPLTECPAGIECGQISDGCDGMINCGSCVAPETCGGGGVANECGAPQCDPLTCESTQAECGWIGDGCGLAVNCGPCPMGQVCGAGGPNQCDGCQPRTCESAGAECGAIGDGCGGVVQCGSCETGKTCGAQTANQCGSGPSCTPRTCASINAECGTIGDGCGGTLDCGICEPGFVCGIEEAFQCDPAPDCVPLSCEDQDAECGAIGDGCGGLLDCGGCPTGSQCGLVTANECSVPRVTK